MKQTPPKSNVGPLLLAAVLLLFSAGPATADPIRVALLGDSRSSSEDPLGVNTRTLGRIFSNIRAQNPDAVFFLGDMVYGKGHPPRVKPEAHGGNEAGRVTPRE